MTGSIFIVLFAFVGLSSALPVAESTVQDWVTLNSSVKIVNSRSTGYESEYGVLKHVSSQRLILPDGGQCPNDENRLRIGSTLSSKANLFRFVQQAGHLGFIEHDCGRIIHPQGGSLNPKENTRTVLHQGHHVGAHFYFDEESDYIVHRGEKRFHPHGGSPNPSEGTEIRLHSGEHAAATFVFVPESGEGGVYPPPVMTGRWEVLFAVIDPISEHTFHMEYKIGKSITQRATEIISWKVSASMAFGWFKSNSEFWYYACRSEEVTWMAEIERSYTIKVYPGRTSVTWQWIFEANQFDEGMRFRSSILGDTDDINRPPAITPEVNDEEPPC